MGNVTTKRKARKATFTFQATNGVREYTPVNKRAKMFAAVFGAEVLNTKDLRKIKRAGIRVYAYQGGKLRSVTL